MGYIKKNVPKYVIFNETQVACLAQIKFHRVLKAISFFFKEHTRSLNASLTPSLREYNIQYSKFMNAKLA